MQLTLPNLDESLRAAILAAFAADDRTASADLTSGCDERHRPSGRDR